MYEHPHILHFCIYAFTNTPELYSQNTHHFHVIIRRRSYLSFFWCVLRSGYYCTSCARHRSTALWEVKRPLRIHIPVWMLQTQEKAPNSSEYAGPPYLTSTSSHTIYQTIFSLFLVIITYRMWTGWFGLEDTLTKCCVCKEGKKMWKQASFN